jgi:hypothetical protein
MRAAIRAGSGDAASEHVLMRIRPIALAAIVTIGLAGCGGSTASSSSGGSQPAAAISQPTTSSSSADGGVAPAATSSASTTSTTASSSVATSTAGSGSGGASLAGADPCRASDLSLSFLGGQGATGHGELGFAMTNTSQSDCTTGGYPGIQFLDKNGGALSTTPEHTTSDFFGNLALAELTVAPGQAVSFRLGTSHGEGGSALCSTAYGLQVIAPNDTATMSVKIPGGAPECGSTTVSPVQPGDSAYK